MFKTQYRVVTDNYAGYEVQYKPWWWPFWRQVDGPGKYKVNTFISLEAARDYANKLRYRPPKGREVWRV